jgi:O-antigen ligase
MLFIPFSWFLVYFLISNIVDTAERYFVFMLSFLLYSLKMGQHGTRGFIESGGGFRTWGATGAPGWFQNSGEFAIQMCIFFSISVMWFLVLRRNWSTIKQLFYLAFPFSAVISVIASSSRGGQLALGAGIGWLMMKSMMTRYRWKAIGAAVLVAVCAVALIPPEQWTRFSEMGTDQTSTLRITYWKNGLEVFRTFPVFGIGYDNWITYYMVHFSKDVQLPHNIFIQAAAELGSVGLIAFLVMIVVTFTTNYRTRKLTRQLPGGGAFLTAMSHGLDSALVGYLVAGFFVTVLHYPFFWINFAFTVSLYHTATQELRRSAGVPVPHGTFAGPQAAGRRGRIPQRVGRAH